MTIVDCGFFFYIVLTNILCFNNLFICNNNDDDGHIKYYDRNSRQSLWQLDVVVVLVPRISPLLKQNR